MKYLTSCPKLMIGALIAALVLPFGFANAVDGTLTIVTSYPPDTTTTFKKAFEKKYPGVKVEMLKKKTTAGIKYLQETSGNNKSDMFWASAPDAFEVLKGDNLLVKYDVKVKGIPEKVGSFPVNDPDGYYKGFAASGYGIMWNTRYLKAKKLPVATEWAQLKNPIYNGHVGMSAPSRSGTTHLTVETLIQGMGWDKGWAEWKAIGGNFKTITARSFGVPDGVNSGSFGLGVVIDFFGLSSKASGSRLTMPIQKSPRWYRPISLLSKTPPMRKPLVLLSSSCYRRKDRNCCWILKFAACL